MEEQRILFREKQRFKQFWLWALILGIAAVFWAGFVYQVVLGGAFGNRPVTDIQLSLMLALISFGLPFFFYYMTLTTEVLPGMLQVRFRPFHLKPVRIPLHTVRDFERVTYNPIGEYGGWGIRWGAKGKAYSTSGREGILLRFYNTQPLLIGSQRSKELFQAIEQGKASGKGIAG
ncbi:MULTISPECIES: DUF6141 family protein [Pontibacter]|uniref:Uncharacterized protein n=1 Tax=Pontibacter lucknowensis TaxID=1077936 RepID=A0A1N6THL9_9BACT|nr:MULTISPECIES: DUF6141 family protein [Pontibacter]EJF10013.1 hypothetical protein O71_11589 [Pontibacter sp. BAB1700]SIQ52737.1 hypothetical protein SAMN05421545_0332 [Pontibacter lucknowensis]